MRSTLAALLLFCATLAAARAQSVRWEASDSGSSAFQLIFDDCAPDGAPELPAVSGLTFRKIGESSSTNIINFDVRRSIIHTYLVSSRQNAPIQIPPFTVKTNRGVLRVAAFNAAAPAASAASVAGARLIPERPTVWAGEVFGLVYELNAASRANPQISPNFEWNSAPLTIEDWSKPEVTEDPVGGERRARVTYRTRASARTPNTVKLEAATHLINIQTGTVGFGFFTQSRMEPVSVTSDQPVITVRPLPAGAPAGFAGAVGEFELVSEIVPENAGVGEPITWTLELKGTGNWPDIAGLPSREVSKDFQVVQPKARRTPTDNKLFDVVLAEDVVLVPTKPGNYPLGPVSFTYFDPKSGTYKTKKTEAKTCRIAAPAAPKLNLTVAPSATAPAAETPPAPAAAPAGPTPAQIENLKTKSPVPPAGLPRDPLPGSAIAAPPLPVRTWLAWIVAPLALPALVWAWLAVRRAQTTDPLRPRREARQRLARTLAQLRSGPLSPQLLLAWQRDAAVLWQLHHAAPPPSATGDAGWSALWAECDRALYSSRTELPSDWVARADAALAARPVAGFNPLRALLPRNLFPFAAAIAALLLIPCSILLAAAAATNAADGHALYRRGDFAGAEKSWRAATLAAPTNWIARYNLSLALAQQERPAESAAHAAAAFVQQPGSPATRWHLVLASEKAAFVPAGLGAFLSPDAHHALARQASPAVWQYAAVAASALVALALCTLLLGAYGRRQRLTTWLAGSAIVAAVVGGAISGWSWQTFGTTGDPRAVVVTRAGTLRSIPTEADTAQKTTPVTAGSVALAVTTFLDGRWTKLQFDNGQTGWVRSAELVGLWR
ncbi:MAG: BatD family protein [Verrucomicrobia bacterium]|nr:BatD family protein [Verrucomicrobiota bacterium]